MKAQSGSLLVRKLNALQVVGSALLVLLAGCTEGPEKALLREAPMLASLTTTVDGVSWTVNPNDNSVSIGTGHKIMLTPEVALQLVNTFQAIQIVDGLADELENVPQPPPTCAGGGSCEELRAPSSADLLATMEPSLPPVLPYRGVVMKRVSGSRLGMRQSAPNLRSAISLVGSVYSSFGAQNCTDISTAIFHKTLEYREKKAQYMSTLNSIKSSLPYEVIGSWLQGSFHDLPAWAQGLATDLEMTGSLVLESQLALNFLASSYSMNGCWGQNWTGLPAQPPAGGFPTPPPGLQWSCHYEDFDLSVDGGLTWQRVTARVCSWTTAHM